MSAHERRWLGVGVAPLGLLAAVAIFEAVDEAGYRLLAQEDGPIEWASVTVTAAAALVFALLAKDAWRARARAPWFEVGLALFSVFVAGEEISWGQRAIAFAPPDYFLEHNEQQELNVHNLFKDVLRTKYILMALVGVWGIALPLARTRATVAALAERLGVLIPPLALVPGFAGTLVVLVAYPWHNTGEVAELTFGVELFATAAYARWGLEPRGPVWTGVGVGAALVVGVLIAEISAVLLGSDEDRSAVARVEVARLARDWEAERARLGRTPSRCGTHLRLYTWVRDRDHAPVREGSFATGPVIDAALEAPARRSYFLDPWNNPYWLWHVCDDDDVRILVYSFGPNRRRDSLRAELRGDDPGASVAGSSSSTEAD